MFGRNQHSTNASDEVLVNLVINGDKAAFEQLYDRYFDLLFRFSFGYLKQEAAAEDLVQDVFVNLPQLLQKFNTQKQFRTWVMSVVANRCKNNIRNEANQDRIVRSINSSRSTKESIEQKMDMEKLREEILQILKECSSKEQELYHLRFQMDLTIDEIAETMNIPAGSVKSGLFYLLKKIRKPLKRLTYELK